jgi:hypothetical protein
MRVPKGHENESPGLEVGLRVYVICRPFRAVVDKKLTQAKARLKPGLCFLGPSGRRTCLFRYAPLPGPHDRLYLWRTQIAGSLWVLAPIAG